jgi:signal transduction histidine kinase
MVLFADPMLPFTQLNSTGDVHRRIYNGNVLRDRITSTLSRITGRETDLLRDREKENSRSIASFNKAFSELLAGMAVLVVVAFFSIRYNFNRLLRIDEQLRTAQERTEKALANEIETNKLKSNFVALASHEFRTPLTTVLSSAALIENYSFGENQAKVDKHLARIKSSVSSLTSILNEFLSLEKIEKGKVTPNIERFDMKQYLQGCVSNMQNFAKEGQTIFYNHTGPADVETDPVFMGNIINNLVTNAIKYSPQNSLIYISSHVNEKIHLTVQDKGIGIPEQDQRHLFERFYRASNAGTMQGTGLGLHIMMHYVDLLHGTVKLNSEVGKGTTVFVTLDNRSGTNNNQHST